MELNQKLFELPKVYERNKKEVAKTKELEIEYQCQDYLQLHLDKTYNLITMIYCDYGVLSKNERKKIIEKAYNCLEEGVVFLFDVFNEKKYHSFKEAQSW